MSCAFLQMSHLTNHIVVKRLPIELDGRIKLDVTQITRKLIYTLILVNAHLKAMT